MFSFPLKRKSSNSSNCDKFSSEKLQSIQSPPLMFAPVLGHNQCINGIYRTLPTNDKTCNSIQRSPVNDPLSQVDPISYDVITGADDREQNARAASAPLTTPTQPFLSDISDCKEADVRECSPRALFWGRLLLKPVFPGISRHSLPVPANAAAQPSAAARLAQLPSEQAARPGPGPVSQSLTHRSPLSWLSSSRRPAVLAVLGIAQLAGGMQAASLSPASGYGYSPS